MDFQKSVQKYTSIPIEAQRLFHNGQILSPKVFESCKLLKKCYVQLAKKTINSEKSESKCEITIKFETAWTLLNNCEKCLEAIDQNLEPSERQKIISPVDCCLKINQK